MQNKSRGTAVYTSSWVAPKSDVHSQQRELDLPFLCYMTKVLYMTLHELPFVFYRILLHGTGETHTLCFFIDCADSNCLS